MKDSKIHLRPPEPNDIDFILAVENEEALWSVSTTYIPFSRFAVEQYVLNIDQDLYTNGQLRMLIEQKEDNVLIGCVDFFEFDPRARKVGVGILIQPEFQHQGYASMALVKMIQIAFERLGLHQISCLVHPDNKHSIRLFESHGFEQNGVKKDWAFYEGEFHDMNFYQLINTK